MLVKERRSDPSSTDTSCSSCVTLRRAGVQDVEAVRRALTAYGHRPVVEPPVVAIVAEHDGELVAVGVGYSLVDPNAADIAIVSDCRHRGLGAVLGRAVGMALCERA